MLHFAIKEYEKNRKYIGFVKDDNGLRFNHGPGVVFGPSGKLLAIGIFQRKGLRYGIDFYENGHIRTIAVYNDEENTSYYGPSYPIRGRYYSTDGKLIYKGKFVCSKIGSLGWPRIVEPEGYHIWSLL